MSYRINIDEIDTDGAVRQAPDAVGGDTRASFLRAGVIGLINDPTGAMITPSGAFDTPDTAEKVLAAVRGTGFIVG